MPKETKGQKRPADRNGNVVRLMKKMTGQHDEGYDLDEGVCV